LLINFGEQFAAVRGGKMKIRIPCKRNVKVTVYRVVRNNERKKNEKLKVIYPIKNDEKGKIYDLEPGEYVIEMKIYGERNIREGRRRIKIQETKNQEITEDNWSGDFKPNFEVL
jgi:hypothetical protein